MCIYCGETKERGFNFSRKIIDCCMKNEGFHRRILRGEILPHTDEMEEAIKTGKRLFGLGMDFMDNDLWKLKSEEGKCSGIKK